MRVIRHRDSARHTAPQTVVLAIIVLTFLMPMSVSNAASPLGGFQMQVRPRLCVLAPGEQVCVMRFSVSWAAPQAADVCLQIAGELSPVRCWQAQRSGEIAMSIERRNTALVQLRDATNDTLLLEEKIPIIRRDLRDTRARRRHAWSIL